MHAFAHSVGPWALPAVIVSSTLGALLMCVLALGYRWASAAEPEPGPAGASRRWLFTRLGYAAAGTCFTVSTMLAIVALLEHGRAATSMGAVEREVRVLRERLATLDAQVGPLQTRLGTAEARAGAAASRASAAQVRLAGVLARLDRVETRLAAAGASSRQAGGAAERALVAAGQLTAHRATPAANATAPAPAERPDPAWEDRVPREPPRPTPVARSGDEDWGEEGGGTVRTTLRETWETVTHEGRAAGQQLGKAFRKLREALRP
jgi:hypothetical protein